MLDVGLGFFLNLMTFVSDRREILVADIANDKIARA